MSTATVISSELVQTPFIKMKKNKKSLNPSTANPATQSPITVPPPKKLSMPVELVRAACVLTFVLVAIFIPIFPAKAERRHQKQKITMNR
jgi:hypothetical protein